MRKTPSCFLVALALSHAAGTAAGSPAAGGPAAGELPPANVLQAAGLAHGWLERLALPPSPEGACTVELPLHGAVERLELTPHSVRAAGFRLLVQGPGGAVEAVAPAPPATYRGRVAGYPESVVAATLEGGQLRAFLRLEPGLAPVGVEPLSKWSPGAERDVHLVYDAGDALPTSWGCGVGGPLPVEAHPGAAAGGGTAGGGAEEAQIAFDADVEYFQKLGGSVFGTQLDVETVLNGVDAIYGAQVGIVYEISAILVRTAEPDPYSTSSAGGLLSQLESHWISSQGSIERDQTHLFTGRNLAGSTIGIAEFSSVCGDFQGYGLSESRFNGATQLQRIGLTAHELGHNWAASHCDGLPGCAIMCSNIGGCGGGLQTFGPTAVSQITNKKNASGCLEAPAPTPAELSSVSPPAIFAFQGGTLSVLGSHLSDVELVEIGGSAVPDTKVTSAFGELRVESPLLTTLGPQEIRVTQAAGTVGGLFVEALEATDVALAAPGLTVPGFPFRLEWSGGAENVYFLNLSTSGLTVPSPAGDVLAAGAVGLTGTLSEAGTGAYGVESIASFGFITLFFQVVVFDPDTASLLGVSPVMPTLFL